MFGSDEDLRPKTSAVYIQKEHLAEYIEGLIVGTAPTQIEQISECLTNVRTALPYK